MIRNDLQHIQLDSQKSKQEPALHEQEADCSLRHGLHWTPTYSEQEKTSITLILVRLFSLFTGPYTTTSPWTIRHAGRQQMLLST
jgi:methylmalonyl-CoA mutase